jgi:mRNA interferase YafQ
MTRILQTTKQFEKDILLMKKRGKNVEKFREVLDMILNGVSLASKYRNHKLLGSFKNRFECHIEPDWLLIYFLDENTLRLERTGTHSDLF